MSGNDSQLSTLRPSRHESERLLVILAISLLLHLLCWGTYKLGEKYGWWDQLHWPAWLHRQTKLAALPPPPVQPEEPLEFVSVDDPSTVAPKNAKYYASHNSQAADQTNEKDTDQPKVDGKQTDSLHMEDALRPQKTTPKPPEPKPTEEQKVAQKAQEAGDLTVGKPQPEKTPEEKRPRTLAQAAAQQKTPGLKARLDGGAMRQAVRSSLNAIGTPWGQYDEAIVDAVTQYWYNELDSQKFALNTSGKVIVQFRLNEDGTVTEVKELGNTVGFELGLVCQDAITGPAPFAKWPPGMRQDFGKNYRIITFTFDYLY